VKIPNPWPYQPHIRFNVNNGECTGSCGGDPEIEVPDTAVEVLIEPCARGRYNSETLAPGRVWSKEFGMLDVEDHLKKVEIKKEFAKARSEAERLRVRNGEEALKAKSEESKVSLKDVVKIDQESFKVEPAKIDVARAACGLAKVTKAPKLKK